MGIFRTFSLPVHTDERFSLIPLEVKHQLGFEVRRVYAIVDGKQPSGSHCHKVEEEVFFVARGGAVAVIDDGSGLRDITLTQGDAMYVGAYVWHHFKNFDPGTVVIALSSTPYNPSRADYVIDYEEFKSQVSKHNE